MAASKGQKVFLHSNKTCAIMGSMSFGFGGTITSDGVEAGLVNVRIDTFSPDTPLYMVKQNDGRVVACEYYHEPRYNHPEDLACWPATYPNTDAFNQFVSMLQSGSSSPEL